MFETDAEEFQAIVTWIVSFSVFIMMVAFFGCVCGCKKKNADKDDWLGKEGKVKPLNSSDDDPVLRSNGEAQKSANRTSTANRSLPDIPVNEPREVDPNWDSNQLTNTSDNCSELYATVGENPNPDGETKNKKRQAPRVPSPENSLSESTLANLKVSSHQYAKLSHPYARVKPPPPKNDTHASTSTVTQPSIELESSENTPGTQGGSETTLSSGTDQPVPPPRTRRSSSQSNLFHPSSSSPSVSMARSANTLPSYPASSSSPTLMPDSIPAGPAIMGKISASQELPYITLPIDNNLRHNSVPADLPNHSDGQNDANGPDEVDNAERREDLEQRNLGAGHFSGDSQDSSKGYTSISVREPLASIRAQTGQINRRLDPHYATVSDDSDEMYAAIEDRSGSDTYAQIVPLPQQQPPPPSVDSLRNTVAENHSRQASSSSAASSVAVFGSPKPEKRQANSPLPPPPSVPPPNVSPPPTPTPLPQSKLDEMYAKVNKKKNSKENTPTHVASKEAAPRSDSVALDINSGYESLQSGRPSLEPNYESVTSTTADNDSASGYAVVAPKIPNDPGYELVRNPARNSYHQHADPNYEELGQKVGSIHEPNYEILNEEPNYEPLKSSSSTQDDPNYESVSSLQEPPYEQLNKAADSAGDILYATVNKINKKAT